MAGSGSTGVGGAGGTISLGTFNVQGGVNIQLGNGGTGFTAGGTGASLTTGIITSPTTTVLGQCHRGRQHDPRRGARGRHRRKHPHAGGRHRHEHPDRFQRRRLRRSRLCNAKSQPARRASGQRRRHVSKRRSFCRTPFGAAVDAITVGDLLGNGHLDIAVGSADQTQSAGIAVYISKFDTSGAFTGFSQPVISPMPDLFSGNPNGGLIFSDNFELFLRSNTPVTGLVASMISSGTGHRDLGRHGNLLRSR